MAVNHNLARKNLAEIFRTLARELPTVPRKNAVAGARKWPPREPFIAGKYWCTSQTRPKQTQKIPNSCPGPSFFGLIQTAI
jgi:hypothetical protein